VSESFSARPLRKLPVPDIELDGRERNAVILGYDNFEAVGQDLVSNELFEGRALRVESTGRRQAEQGAHHRGGGAGAVGPGSSKRK
jgi:hypothetical protein